MLEKETKKEIIKEIVNFENLENIIIKKIDVKIPTKNNIKEKTELNLIYINSIQAHNKDIYYLTTFPSGNLITVSKDWSIKIWDKNFNLIQLIENAHEDGIEFIDVKDENNFISCSSDYSIRIWKKEKDIFKLNQTINNAHSSNVNQVIYTLNNELISCSWDKTIIIWELNNNLYQKKTIINHNGKVCAILLLEKRNILITSGTDGTKVWKFNNLEFIYSIDYTICGCWNCLKQIDNDRIIVRGKKKKKHLILFQLIKKMLLRKLKLAFFLMVFV